jgi:putative transposase
MSWHNSSLVSTRERFVLAVQAGKETFISLCRRFDIARGTGYKWVWRYRRDGRHGLFNRSRRPCRSPRRLSKKWQLALRQLRRGHPSWGPRKLRARLRQLHPRVRLPSARTLGRWLCRLQLVTNRRRHQRRGPQLPVLKRTRARAANDVWTIDFKGWFRADDGTRLEPLTVRDLRSRFVLDVRLLPNQSEANVRRALMRVFRRHGLPRAIWVDNGPPFGGTGPLGYSRLAVWWRRLGIRVEFGRPAHPQDNAAHEQMHGIYQAEVASAPAGSRRTCQHRSDRWRMEYNQWRPHEALGLRTPGELYRASPRKLPRRLPIVKYAPGGEQRRVSPDGRLFWHGRQRFIGRALAGEIVRLQSKKTGVWKVYLETELLGVLHQTDRSRSLRAARRAPH